MVCVRAWWTWYEFLCFHCPLFTSLSVLSSHSRLFLPLHFRMINWYLHTSPYLYAGDTTSHQLIPFSLTHIHRHTNSLSTPPHTHTQKHTHRHTRGVDRWCIRGSMLFVQGSAAERRNSVCWNKWENCRFCVSVCLQGALVRLVIDFPICADHSLLAELDAASEPPVSTGHQCGAAEAPLLQKNKLFTFCSCDFFWGRCVNRLVQRRQSNMWSACLDGCRAASALSKQK